MTTAMPEEGGGGVMGCPKCGGTSGYSYSMQVTHHMFGSWGEEAECGDSGRTTQSLVKCEDCGAQFQYWKLFHKGIAQ